MELRTSEEFQSFIKRNGIRHRTTAPYHPATNGLAERAVQVIKNGLKRYQQGDFELRLTRTLFKYRNTPHSTTGVTPSELLMGRKPRTLTDLLIPSLSKRVQEKQLKQSLHSPRVERQFRLQDKVYVRNFRQGEKWLTATIEAVLGPRNYLVQLSSGAHVKRHLDQIRFRFNDEHVESEDVETLPFPETRPNPSESTRPEPEAVLRRSTRERHPPDRYSPGKN